MAGPWCSHCGQKRHRQLSWTTFFQTIALALFSVDAPIWRTVKGLAWNCGQVSNRYLAGKRKLYLGPVQAYLAAALLGLLAEVAGPLYTNEEWQLSAFAERCPRVQVFSDLAIASVDNLPPGTRLSFVWDLQAADATTAGQFPKKQATVGLNNKAVVTIPLPEGKKLKWVCAFLSEAHGNLGCMVWEPGGFDGEEVEKALDGSPALGLLTLVPLFAFFVWLFRLRRRRSFLDYVVFTSYWLAGTFLVYIPVALFFGSTIPIGSWPMLLVSCWMVWTLARGAWTFRHPCRDAARSSD